MYDNYTQRGVAYYSPVALACGFARERVFYMSARTIRREKNKIKILLHFLDVPPSASRIHFPARRRDLHVVLTCTRTRTQGEKPNRGGIRGGSRAAAPTTACGRRRQTRHARRRGKKRWRTTRPLPQVPTTSGATGIPHQPQEGADSRAAARA